MTGRARGFARARMSMILADAADRTIQINAWNWGVLHHQVERAGLLLDDVWGPKRWNASGALAPADVARLASFLGDALAPRIPPGSRMFFDGTITDVPDDGTFFRRPDEQWKNYSLRREVLDEVVEFLRQAVGDVAFL